MHKRSVGRPAEAEEPRDQSINVRLTKSELNALESNGVDVRFVVRAMARGLMAKAKRSSKDLPKAS